MKQLILPSLIACMFLFDHVSAETNVQTNECTEHQEDEDDCDFVKDDEEETPCCRDRHWEPFFYGEPNPVQKWDENTSWPGANEDSFYDQFTK